MLKELTALSFDRIMKNGNTIPFQVLVMDGDALCPYICKSFSTKAMAQSNFVMKEFICSNLASQFDLNTPEVALVAVALRMIMGLGFTILRWPTQMKMGQKCPKIGTKKF